MSLLAAQSQAVYKKFVILRARLQETLRLKTIEHKAMNKVKQGKRPSSDSVCNISVYLESDEKLNIEVSAYLIFGC